MRIRRTAIFFVGASALVLAGCTNGAATPSASGSTSPKATGSTVAGGPVASCVVGDWVSTAVLAQASMASNNATINGGKGVAVRVGSTGQTELAFAGMEPVKFVVSAAGTTAKGQFVYGGKASGQVKTGDLASMTGVWEPIGTANWGEVKITLDLTEPLPIRLLDNALLSDYANDQTGGAVDVNPMLGKATYKCGAGTLELSPAGGNGLTWKLVKK